MWQMLEALRVDLPTAVREGELSTDTLGAMMRTCSFCNQQDLCQLFIDVRRKTADKAPSYCPLKSRMTALQDSCTGPAPERVMVRRVKAEAHHMAVAR